MGLCAFGGMPDIFTLDLFQFFLEYFAMNFDWGCKPVKTEVRKRVFCFQKRGPLLSPFFAQYLYVKYVGLHYPSQAFDAFITKQSLRSAGAGRVRCLRA